jgi:hypothetical protein
LETGGYSQAVEKRIAEQQIGALLSDAGPVFVDLKITSSGPQRRDYSRLHGAHVRKVFLEALAAG